MSIKKIKKYMSAKEKEQEFDRLICEISDTVDKYPNYRLTKAGNILFVKGKIV